MGSRLDVVPTTRVFGWPAARLALAVAGGIFAVAALAGAVRVLPILLAPGVPSRVALPLARGALGVALETSLFVAPPLAWAVAAARLVDRGEARALHALGVRPLRIVASGWPAALVVAVAAALASASWGREAAAPGRLARQLVADARLACIGDTIGGPAAVDVPLVGLSWACFPGQPPRALGRPPFGGGRAAFAAREIELADDLRAIHFEELTVVAPVGARGIEHARMRAGRAHVHGMAPLGRASNLGVLARTVLLAASAVALAVAAAMAVLVLEVRNSAAAAALGVLAAGASLLVFSALERGSTMASAYLAVPAVGLGSLLAAAAFVVWRRHVARSAGG
jgi:hypothetical protein